MNEQELAEYHRLLESGTVRYGFLYSQGGANQVNKFGTATRQINLANKSGSTTTTFVADGGTGHNAYNSYAGVDIVAAIMLPGHEPLVIGELSTISYSIHRENVPVRTLGHVSPLAFTKGPRTIAGSMIFTVFNEYAFYRLNEWSLAQSQYGIYPLADMLPAFDIIITFANEYAATSKMRIQGVSIIDEGQTMSIEDLVTEQTYQYMARAITPLVRQKVFVRNEGSPNSSQTSSVNP